MDTRVAINLVLESADVFPLIVEQIAASSDLYSLAQVARVVSDCALNSLWSVLPTSFHLLTLLPCFGLTAITGGRTYGLKRDPVPQDLVAFDRYAFRIQKVQNFYSSAENRGRDDIDANIFVVLHQLRPEVPLFPSLRILHIPRLPGSYRNYQLKEAARGSGVMRPLLSERLHSLHVNLPKFAADYLCHLLDKPNSLRNLRITGPLSTDVLRAIGRFSALENLDLNFRQGYRSTPIEAYLSMLQDISSLKHLRTLLLFPPFRHWERTPIHASFRFSELSKLAVSGDLESFLSICSTAPIIEYLILDVCQAPALDAWPPFFRHLAQLCPGLRHLEIYHKHFEKARPLPVADYIEPLFPLRLESLRLFSDESVILDLSDRGVSKIGSSFPNLKHLDLFATGTYIDIASSPTLQSVINIMAFCPNLEYLRMKIEQQVLNRHMHVIDTPSTMLQSFSHSSLLHQ